MQGMQEKPHFPNVTPQCAKVPLLLPSPVDNNSVMHVPACLNQYLRDYQREGVVFMHHLYENRRGGLLCDDMGLGKTVQVIAFLSAILGKSGTPEDQHMRKKDIRRFQDAVHRHIIVLIVCPSSVIYNWKREFETWGFFSVGIFHGPGKNEVLERAKQGYYEVVLTSYDTCRINELKVNEIKWSLLVVDEVHRLKEDTSAITQTMKRLQIACKLGLTGTAIQNRYKELWCLLDWCNPSMVGSMRDWESNISRKLKKGQSHKASKRDLADARHIATKLKEQILNKWMLRRTKALIAHQLPKKEDQVIFCPLTPTQRIVYERLLRSENFDILVRKNEICDCAEGMAERRRRGECCYTKNGDGVHWKYLVLGNLITLQKISNHLALIMPNADDDAEKREKDLELTQIAFPNDWQTRKPNFHEYRDPENCGKWKILERLLENWKKHGCKVLLFSMSVRLLNMLEKLMYSASYDYCRLDGKTPIASRMDIVDEFNNDPAKFVFLISTRAGGVGLNLTSANIVVVFDPNWNPSHDLQAQDRAYRIGQSRDVKVYRLIAAGSLEELVYGRQIYKQQQANIGYTASNERRYFEGVMGDPTQQGELFGTDNLFALHQESDIITKLILKRTEAAEITYDVADFHISDTHRDDDDDTHEPVKTEEHDDDEVLAEQLRSIDKETAHNRQSRIERDTVAAILDEEGISYTHINDEIIASSKIEERISMHAKKAVEMCSNTQAPAFAFEMDADEDDADEADTKPDMHEETHPQPEKRRATNAKLVSKKGRIRTVVGATPEHIREQQLHSMARFFKYPTTEAFAEYYDQAPRKQRDFLRKAFYDYLCEGNEMMP